MVEELIDELMVNLQPYIEDDFSVKNALYLTLMQYDIQKKSTEIMEYQPQDNELLLKKFLVAKKVKGCTDRTLHYYANQIVATFRQINKNIIETTTNDIRYYIAQRLRTGVSKVTVNNEIRVLRSLYGWLAVEEILPKNPMNKIDSIKQEKRPKKAFTDDEIVRMRDLLRCNRERAIFEILLSTGCRVTELVNIKVSEVDYINDKILVHGKGQKDRYVYLNATSKYALQQYMSERTDNNPYLFPAQIYDGKPGKNNTRVELGPKLMYTWYQHDKYVSDNKHASTSGIEQTMRELGKKCNVKAYPHKFRRTCATNALRNGMPIEMVSKMLGHANLSVTQLYLDIKEDDLKAMHKKYVR